MAKRSEAVMPEENGEDRGRPGRKPLDGYSSEDVQRLCDGLKKRLERLVLIQQGMKLHRIEDVKLANKENMDEMLEQLREVCEQGRRVLNKIVPAGARQWDELDY